MHFLKKPLTVALAIANLGVATALAQEAEPAKEEKSTGLLEEVTVTATKRETDLMDTPVAITAFSQAQLERAGATNVRDLAGLVPNLDIGYEQDQASPVISMRGVRSTNTSELGDPSVGLHMDGIYSPRPQGAMALMFDVERVEALRGPQGTLFGRNSTVGVVNVISRRPDTESFEANVGVELGSWDNQVMKGVMNLPVSDTFALRASFIQQTRDSYLDGYYDPNQWDRRRLPGYAQNAPDLVGDAQTLIQDRNWWGTKKELVKADGEDFYNNIDQYAFRLAALWEPTEKISWLTSIEKYQDQGAGSINTLDCDKLELAGNSCENIYGPGADQYTVAVNTPGELDLSIESFRSSFRWDFSDEMAFIYNAGYAVQDRSNLVDIDAGVTDWDMEIWFVDTEYASQSHELQLQSTGDGKLQWIAGAFYFKEKNDMDGLFNAHMNDSAFWDQPNRTLESEAVFGQMTYELTEKLFLTAGYRYSKDTKQDVGGRNLSCNRDWGLGEGDAGFPGCYPAWVWADGLDADDYFNQYSADHFANPDIYSVATNNDNKGSWSDSTFRLGLDYDLTDDVMLYAYVADGFKAGGIGDVVVEYLQDPLTAEYATDENGEQIIEQVYQQNYDPERVTTFEIGAKGSFFDGSLNLAATYFLSDYTDMQLAAPESVHDVYAIEQNPDSDNFGEVITNGVVVYNTRNAAESMIQGVEVEFQWAPIENGVFGGYVTWLDTEITSDFETRWNFANRELFEIPDYGLAHSNENPLLYRNLKGNELAASPEFALTINYAHTFELGNGDRIIPFVNVHWEDDSYLSYWNVDKHDFPTPTPEAFSDTREAFTTVDVSIRYVTADDKISAELFGYNVTDEIIPYWASAGDGVVRAPMSVPANYGVRFNYTF
ncbi:TonB-dependent receptor [Biformimicrobium ophioploci]|uniref:TonB-dependent receptor n=1 Tax=Biformimicrobium ophioploci TaxID=3036711 RepID=A0ABQ6M0S7_9GAMM|nr:TonB-dependent receptor [Microbulbifer sp. NKW57]GMG87948.1 hypothetical protein MNKW57_22690 [Microbulbifer sp. NKW57]